MKKQTYQMPEIRDASNNIVQSGTYGRYTPLTNADNTGVLDYINNNLEALHDAQQTGAGVRAAADAKGEAIDIAALKKLITDTVTQAKKDAILAAHPVGSYYISDKATDPGTLFGGTWKMLDPGLTLISQGKGTDKFGSFEFVAGQTYGERLHQLTVDELVEHNHDSIIDDRLATDDETRPSADAWYQATHWTKHYRRINNNVMYEGASKPHNNLQPAKAVFVWLRVS